MKDNFNQKYNHPVPRYTSYPPANFFNSGFTGEDYREALIESNHLGPSNISLYIHVPFCKSRCWYCGCNSCPMESEETIRNYFNSLKKEVNMVKEQLDNTRLVSQIHYGGGTPNSVPADLIKEMNKFLFSSFSFIDDPEIAIECHPAYLTMEYISSLKESGFNRYSIGIQDFKESVLASVHRDSPALPLTEIIKILKEDEKKISINLDFMYGLPNQTPKSFAETISIAISHMPERITTFPYAHVPWINKLQKNLEREGLPGSESRSAMLEAAQHLLLKNGYLKIAMDHYALPGDELEQALITNDLHRNFQGYCTRRTTGQVYAFGISGISQLVKSYAMNVKEVETYIRLVSEGNFATEKGYRLNDKEMLVRNIISELMCNKILNWKRIAEQFDMSVESVRSQAAFKAVNLEMFEKDGLIIQTPEEIRITDAGEPFLRVIASAFDPMYKQEEGKFSRSL